MEKSTAAADETTDVAPEQKRIKTSKKDNNNKKRYNVLILGASYGSLLSSKLLLAGHDVTLVCREATAKLFNTKGSIVRIPTRSSPDIELRSKDLQGTLSASTPENVFLHKYDLCVLAMQEPQYSATGVRELICEIASAKIPVMAVTNMPLLPYLKRIPSLEITDQLRSCFTEASLWDGFEPSVFTQCSPDPQAVRPPEEQPNVLQVKLPTNFKAAKFQADSDSIMLQDLEKDIQDARFLAKEVPVKLRVFDSLFVPLAKWAMLMTGNYRCILSSSIISIKDAVCGNVDASRAIYEWVVEVCIGLGGSAQDFVPFDKYRVAAESLVKPSSAARALESGATNLERVDKVVQLIAQQQKKQLNAIDNIVTTVDGWIERNKQKAAAAKEEESTK